jgi:hypothetical protein
VVRLSIATLGSHNPEHNQFLGTARLRSLATHKIAGCDTFFGILNPKTNQLRFWQGIALKGGVIDTYVSTALQKTPSRAGSFTAPGATRASRAPSSFGRSATHSA